jgi:hypothetical protein
VEFFLDFAYDLVFNDINNEGTESPATKKNHQTYKKELNEKLF